MKAVIFDLDQTLLDRERSLLAFVRWQCRGMLRSHINDEEAFVSRFIALDANGAVWKDRVYEALVEEFKIEGWSTAELLSVYENCFCAFAVPKLGVPEALEEISVSYRLGLISNGMSPFQERNFRALGLSSHFKSVIVSEAVHLRKPDPRIFHRCCDELGVIPSNALYVGDHPVTDMEGARDAGLKTIFIPTDLHPHCPAADATCHDMGQLARIINQLSEQSTGTME